MRLLSFTVSGRPKGKGRPRFKRITGHTYTDPKTVEYEQRIVDNFIIEHPDAKPESGPVTLHVTANFGVPKGESKKTRALMLEGAIRPTMTPDADNVLKVVGDALNGVAYDDDKQIVFATVTKHYAKSGSLVISICPTLPIHNSPHDKGAKDEHRSSQDDDLAKG